MKRAGKRCAQNSTSSWWVGGSRLDPGSGQLLPQKLGTWSLRPSLGPLLNLSRAEEPQKTGKSKNLRSSIFPLLHPTARASSLRHQFPGPSASWVSSLGGRRLEVQSSLESTPAPLKGLLSSSPNACSNPRPDKPLDASFLQSPHPLCRNSALGKSPFPQESDESLCVCVGGGPPYLLRGGP